MRYDWYILRFRQLRRDSVNMKTLYLGYSKERVRAGIRFFKFPNRIRRKTSKLCITVRYFTNTVL